MFGKSPPDIGRDARVQGAVLALQKINEIMHFI